MAQGVTVDFNANLTRFTTALDKATNDLSKFASGAKGQSALMTGIFQGIGQELVRLDIPGKLVGIVSNAIDTADSMGKMAQKVGVGVEALSALNYAASLSDVTFESLGTGLKKLSQNAADTARGTGEAKEAFAALGINVKDSSGNLKSADVLLGEISGKFAGFEDGATKTALAMKLMGKSGADMIPLLNLGADGLARMKSEADSLGLIITPEQAAAAEEFNDNLTRLKASASGLAIEMSGPLLKSINQVIARFDAGGKSGKGFFENIFDSFLSDGNRLSGRVSAVSRELAEATEVLVNREQSAEKSRGKVGILGQKLIDSRLESARERVADLRKQLSSMIVEANELSGKTDAAPQKETTLGGVIVDKAFGDKNQEALRKAFNLKPLEDFVAGFADKRRKVAQEMALLRADLTGPSTSGAKGGDIASELAKGRSALSNKDSIGADVAASRATEMLKNLRDNGGITDEINYYSRQLEQFQQDTLTAQEGVAKKALADMNEEILRANESAEKLKFQIDVPWLTEQIKNAMSMVQKQLTSDPLIVPAVAGPSVGYAPQFTGGSSLTAVALKTGGRA